MKTVAIELALEGHKLLCGDLAIPKSPRGLVLFVHGSGSSRLSTRNQFVADTLQKQGCATFLFDLLTPEEDRIDAMTREFRFDIRLLADRLVQVTKIMSKQSEVENLPLGYFGASTGAAAALIAAAAPEIIISAIVSRGGRPDLAKDFLRTVTCPTLLIVGGHDYEVLELNKWAQNQMTRSETKLEIIPDATHLFEEPGTLHMAALLAAKWFASSWEKQSKPKYNSRALIPTKIVRHPSP